MLAFALPCRFMSLIGDRERERTAALLRGHYLQGRLSIEEFSERLQVALAARRASELQLALTELPPRWRELETIGRPALVVARAAGRATALLALLCVWCLTTLLLMIAVALSLLLDGPSATTLIAAPGLWLLCTYLLGRAARGRRARPHASALTR
jgi:hypothetical protein